MVYPALKVWLSVTGTHVALKSNAEADKESRLSRKETVVSW